MPSRSAIVGSRSVASTSVSSMPGRQRRVPDEQRGPHDLVGVGRPRGPGRAGRRRRPHRGRPPRTNRASSQRPLSCIRSMVWPTRASVYWAWSSSRNRVISAGQASPHTPAISPSGSPSGDSYSVPSGKNRHGPWGRIRCTKCSVGSSAGHHALEEVGEAGGLVGHLARGPRRPSPRAPRPRATSSANCVDLDLGLGVERDQLAQDVGGCPRGRPASPASCERRPLGHRPGPVSHTSGGHSWVTASWTAMS